jgi:hypothetical protein
MFYRIPVNVIHMPLIVFIISDQMFPKPALPNSSLTTFNPACGSSLIFGKVA